MKDVSTNTKMPTQDFLALGLRDFAYIKPAAIIDGESVETVYEIHTADGAVIGTVETRELAFAAVRQNGLEPMSAH
jgi:hypothetical protein